MTPEEIKERLIGVLQELVRKHKEGREKVTDEVVEKFESLKVWN